MSGSTLKVVVTILTISVVTSSTTPEKHSTEINENVRTIVESILREKLVNEQEDITCGNLQRKVENLEKKLETLNKKLVEQDETIADLKMLIHNERIYGNDLENVNENIHDSGENVEEKGAEINKVIGTERRIKRADQNRNNMNENTEAKYNEVNRLIASGRRVKRAVANIAFSAYLTQTNSHTIVGQSIKFDQVLINDGQGYNKYTGAFTAPLYGVYLFTFAFDTRKLTFVRLVINGVNQVDAVANVHTNAESRHSQSMGGNTAIVHVGHGESVLVETYEIPDAETASSDHFRLCTFSGVLLY